MRRPAILAAGARMRRFGPLFDLEDLADTTDASPFGRWFAGVGLASLLGLYAVRCLITEHALFIAGRSIRPKWLVEFDGQPATAIGSLYLFLAAFMHLHWYWTASPRFWGYAQLGKMLAAVGMIGSVLAFFVAVLAT